MVPVLHVRTADPPAWPAGLTLLYGTPACAQVHVCMYLASAHMCHCMTSCQQLTLPLWIDYMCPLAAKLAVLGTELTWNI